MRNVLIEFNHGLGDAVQLTVVLQHLKKYRPDWNVSLRAMRGKHSIGNDYCQRIWHDTEPQPDHAAFDEVFKLGWHECSKKYNDCPSTKACKCLKEVFKIEPDRSLLTYKIHVSETARIVTESYLRSIGCKILPDGKYNAIVIHYQGNTSGDNKNLDHHIIEFYCECVIGSGFIPIILDWDRRSSLPDNKKIFNPGVKAGDIWGAFGSGDAERIVALIDQCSLCVAVDSGPQKCAGATTTPLIGVWTKHSPINFFDICPTAVHFVPNASTSDYMSKNYNLHIYSKDSLSDDLAKKTADILAWNKMFIRGFECHYDQAEKDWVIIQDVYVRDAYKTTILPQQENEVIVDIGAHIGTFAMKMKQRNPKAKIVCVEPCPENIVLLKANVDKFATVIPAACTYDKEEIALLNSVWTSGKSTGGSTVVPLDKLNTFSDNQYWKDTRRIEKITIQEIMYQHRLPIIDILKLDCEGGEFGILENADLDKIGFIVMESHDPTRIREVINRKINKWKTKLLSTNGNCESWHLTNPAPKKEFSFAPRKAKLFL